MLQCDNPFWRFSLAVYAAPGVADECLALQDTRGVDVNVLLFCAWLGSRRDGADRQTILPPSKPAVRPWRERVVQPLRGRRRDIKARPDAADETSRRCARTWRRSNCAPSRSSRRCCYEWRRDGARRTASAESAIRHNIRLLLAGRNETEPERLIEAASALDNTRAMLTPPKLEEKQEHAHSESR